MKILAIDTAFKDGRIGLIHNGKTIAEEMVEAGHLESHTFTTILKLGIQPDLKGVDLIALAAGPGSFTGLKIGAMVAKSLSFLQGTPFKGVGTLCWLAAAADEGIVLPFIRSHGDRVYWGLYKVAGGKSPIALPEELIAPESSDTHRIIEAVRSAGYEDNPNVIGFEGDDADPELPWPTTRVGMPLLLLAATAETKLKTEGKDDPLTFTPIYAARSQAEEKLGEGG